MHRFTSSRVEIATGISQLYPMILGINPMISNDKPSRNSPFLWHSTSPLLFGALHAVNKPFPNWPLDMGWFISKDPLMDGMGDDLPWFTTETYLNYVEKMLKSSQKPLNFPCDDLDLWSPSRPSPSHGPVMVSAAPTLGWCYHPDRCHSSPHWARWGWHWSHSPIENWRIYEKINETKVKPND